jgi:hypothetical protein
MCSFARKNVVQTKVVAEYLWTIFPRLRLVFVVVLIGRLSQHVEAVKLMENLDRCHVTAAHLRSKFDRVLMGPVNLV